MIETTRGVTTTPERATSRMAWLDNVRVWLTVLVLAHHAALTYSDLQLWPYWEQPRDPSSMALNVLVGLNQAWFMGLFFLVSGYFVPASVDRHGIGGFVRGRLLRLGVPYLLFALVLSPVFRYPDWAADPQGEGFASYAVRTYDSGPLWFVLVLLVFSLVYAAVRALRGRVPGHASGRVPGVAVVAAAGLVVGLAMYVWQIWTPVGTYWPVVGLPSPNYLPQYAVCFAIGLAAARRDWLSALRVRTAWAFLPITVVSLAVLALTVLDPGAAGGGTLSSLVSTVFGGLFAAGMMVMTLVVFRSFVDRSGPVWRFASAQAYAVYVLHAPILVWLGVALGGFAAPAAAKAAVLLAAGIVACWTAAWLVRRIPGARRVF